MLEKLYNAIRKDAEPVILKIDGRNYSDKRLEPVYAPDAETVDVSSLTGLVDYIGKGLDDVDLEKAFIHVAGPETVLLLSWPQPEFLNRSRYVRAEYIFRRMSFDHWWDAEPFMIGLQAQFADSGDKGKLLSFLARVTDTSESTYDDSGISQGVTTRKGVASKSAELVPNPVMLAPYRTFTEVPQPVSPFIFRIRKGSNGLEYMLAEADGGAWRNTAMQSIKEYLEKNVPGVAVIA